MRITVVFGPQRYRHPWRDWSLPNNRRKAITFKSTIETLSEAELDVVAGGMIKLDPDNKHPSSPSGNGGGDIIEMHPYASEINILEPGH